MVIAGRIGSQLNRLLYFDSSNDTPINIMLHNFILEKDYIY
jgi:hypothetical protein